MNKRKRSFLSLSLSLQAFSSLCQQKQKQSNSLTSSRSRQIKRPVISSLFFILLYGEGPHQQKPGSRVLILVGVESRYAKKNSTARNSKPPISHKATIAKRSKHNSHARHGGTRRGTREHFNSAWNLPSVFQAFSRTMKNPGELGKSKLSGVAFLISRRIWEPVYSGLPCARLRPAWAGSPQCGPPRPKPQAWSLPRPCWRRLLARNIIPGR